MSQMISALIAEDEALVRIGIKTVITGSGLPVEVIGVAADGKTAMKLYEEHRPDLVITDIRMPEMDGIKLIHNIREQGDDCDIIVISCLDDFETLHKLTNYQIFGYLLKATMATSDVKEAITGVIKKRSHIPSSSNILRAEARKSLIRLIEEYAIHKSIEYDEFERRQAETSALPEYTHMVLALLPVKNSYELMLPSVTEILNERLCGLVCEGRNGLLLCLCRDDSEDFHALLANTKRYIERTCSISITMIGKAIKHIKDLPTELKHCMTAWTDATLNEDFLLLNEVETPTYHNKLNGRSEIKKVLEYMDGHYGEDLSLHSMASLAGLSTNYLSNLFTREVGMSFIRYLNSLRVDKAKVMLSDNDLTIYEIAEKCGYNDESYFNKSFKQKTGVSPGKWKKMNGTRGNNNYLLE